MVHGEKDLRTPGLDLGGRLWTCDLTGIALRCDLTSIALSYLKAPRNQGVKKRSEEMEALGRTQTENPAAYLNAFR